MKYMLILIIIILGVMLATANDPTITDPPYTVAITDKYKMVNLMVPSQIGNVSYVSIPESKEDNLINCLVNIQQIDKENSKTTLYNIKKINADISVYTISKHEDTFKVMVVYNKPEVRLEDNLSNNNTSCDFLYNSSSTIKWLGDSIIGKTTIIPLPDGNELYLQINKSKE